MTDEPHRRRHPMGEPIEVEAEALAHPEVEIPEPEQMSLARRLRQPRTILSIVVPLAVIVIAAWLNRKDLAAVPGKIASANPFLLLVAFVVYYLGFPLRGKRWAMLLHGSGYGVSTKDATEVLFLSWLVNCIVPAKLGDLYRAYLLKMNSPVSATKTLGTIFVERILDLFAIAMLGLAAGYLRFRDNLSTLPGPVQGIFLIAVAIVVVLAVALLAMRNFGRRIISALPLPERICELYDRFEDGVFNSVGVRGLPVLGAITALIWATEAFRLWFVIQALGFTGLHLGLSGVLFVALISSLLTAVPLTPAGLGAVEGGLFFVLTSIFGVPPAETTAIVLLDRAISVFSIVILGAIAYVLSSKPRGSGIPVKQLRAADS